MSTLGEFLARIQQVETIPCPAAEEWADLINRISVPGRIAEVSEDTYWYFLEVLPPKHMRCSMFAFAEGAETVRPWATALLAAFAGLGVGMFFLSFAYHYVLWIYLGLSGARCVAFRWPCPRQRAPSANATPERHGGRSLQVVAL